MTEILDLKGKMKMQTDEKEDYRLKLLLVLQSLFPLFLLIFIKHTGKVNCILIWKFFVLLMKGEPLIVTKVLHNPAFGDITVMLISFTWILITIIVCLGFRAFQKTIYVSKGEKIVIDEEKKESGATFFVSFILPLLIENVSSFQGFLAFLTLLIMTIILLMRSGLFYQNPVLALFNYNVFTFHFLRSKEDEQDNRIFVGLTKGNIKFTDRTIKYKYIADNVYYIALE